MQKLAVVIMSFLLALAVSAAVAKDKDKKVASESAYEHANEHAFF